MTRRTFRPNATTTMEFYHRRFWTLFFLLAVVHQSAVAAFKIPGFSSGSSKPAATGRAPVVAAASSNHQQHGGEYVGPVFIIRELDKASGQYDAFVTTGGIQQVRPPAYPSYGGQQQQNPSAEVPREPDEDSEYFGMLVTPDTVRMLGYPNSVAINVSLPVLLTAVSSRMPWLLVLRRADYPTLFEFHQQQQQQQQQPPVQQPQQSQQQQQLLQQQAQLIVPGMLQIPQRRRYHPDRKRRGLSAYATDGYGWDVDEEYGRGRTVSSGFERELLSTMCYNFVREYSAAGKAHGIPLALVAPSADGERARGPSDEFVFDYDGYARAATLDRTKVMPPPPPPPPQQTAFEQQPEPEQPEQSVQMTVPKRVA